MHPARRSPKISQFSAAPVRGIRGIPKLVFCDGAHTLPDISRRFVCLAPKPSSEDLPDLPRKTQQPFCTYGTRLCLEPCKRVKELRKERPPAFKEI